MEWISRDNRAHNFGRPLAGSSWSGLSVWNSAQKNTKCAYRRFEICNLPMLLPRTGSSGVVFCWWGKKGLGTVVADIVLPLECSYSCIKPQRFGDSGLNRDVIFARHFGIHCSVFSFGPTVESSYYGSTRLVNVKGDFVASEQVLTGWSSLSRSPLCFFFSNLSTYFRYLGKSNFVQRGPW